MPNHHLKNNTHHYNNRMSIKLKNLNGVSVGSKHMLVKRNELRDKKDKMDEL